MVVATPGAGCANPALQLRRLQLELLPEGGSDLLAVGPLTPLPAAQPPLTANGSGSAALQQLPPSLSSLLAVGAAAWYQDFVPFQLTDSSAPAAASSGSSPVSGTGAAKLVAQVPGAMMLGTGQLGVTR